MTEGGAEGARDGRPSVASARHLLPFHQLSYEQFERLCLALMVERGYSDVEHLGAAGRDRGRDVTARRLVAGRAELVYVQCKRLSSAPTYGDLQSEVVKLAASVADGRIARPDVLLFAVTQNISGDLRERLRARCAEEGWQCEFLALTELDREVWSRSAVRDEFFSTGHAGRRSLRRRTVVIGGGAAGVATIGGVATWVASARGSSEVVEVRQRLDLPGLSAMVVADAVGPGQPTTATGCRALEDIPKSWDPITESYEVMFHVRPRRDDVTLIGFEVTSDVHRELGPRVGLACEAGGNGAPSGFQISDGHGGVTVKPVGAGVVGRSMRLYLDPANSIYRIAAWFSSEVARVTEWEGDFLFRYGRGGRETFRLPTGRVRTGALPADLQVFSAQDGRWQPA